MVDVIKLLSEEVAVWKKKAVFSLVNVQMIEDVVGVKKRLHKARRIEETSDFC